MVKLISASILFLKMFFLLQLTPVALAGPATKMEVRAELKNGAGDQIGNVLLTETKTGIKLTITVVKLAPGKHGIHFHEVRKCQGPDFKSAGGHLGSAEAQHGLSNEKGPHLGDLANLEVGIDGTAKRVLESNRVQLRSGKNSLLQPQGSSLVIHAQEDDQKTDPSGGSGDRVACAVISP